MNFRRTIPFIGSLALVAGLWTACTVGVDPTDPDLKFSCETDQDCITPNSCKGGVCTLSSEPGNCTDADDDGYGVGDTSQCELCTQQGLCEEDCDDNDATVNPGAPEICDNVDNDCDMEVDEPLTCMDNIDCPEEQPYLPTCPAGTCEYKPPLQQEPACQTPVACIDGQREERPDECF